MSQRIVWARISHKVYFHSKGRLSSELKELSVSLAFLSGSVIKGRSVHTKHVWEKEQKSWDFFEKFNSSSLWALTSDTEQLISFWLSPPPNTHTLFSAQPIMPRFVNLVYFSPIMSWRVFVCFLNTGSKRWSWSSWSPRSSWSTWNKRREGKKAGCFCWKRIRHCLQLN